MQISNALIVAGTGCSPLNAAKWSGPINQACQQFYINTPSRVSAFLGQIGVESAALTAVTENLNYSAQGLAGTWPSRYAQVPAATPVQPNALANRLSRNPQAIANNVYANRMGNSNEASGDGWSYRGRGLIQITGRAMYLQCGQGLDIDLQNNPQWLEQPGYAALSAAWYWAGHGCNVLADNGNIQAITRVINGGLLAYDRRLALYQQALACCNTQPAGA